MDIEFCIWIVFFWALLKSGYRIHVLGACRKHLWTWILYKDTSRVPKRNPM